MYNSVVIFLCSICLFGTVCGKNNSICTSQQRCGDCMSQLGCTWCSKPNYNPNTHCMAFEQIIMDMEDWCPLDKLWYPEVIYEVIENKNSGINGEAVQIKPQRVKVKVRRGEEAKITFQYAARYPINSQSLNVVESGLANNKTVHITDNAPSTIEIKYHSSCGNPVENGCTNLQLNEVVTFTATLKALECLEGSNVHMIQIKPEGVDEALAVRLEVICSCYCEKPGSSDFVQNSPDCNGVGNATCGICSCGEGYFGSKCECSAESASMLDDANCKIDPTSGQR